MTYVGVSRGSHGRFVQRRLVSHFLTFKVVPMRLHTSASRPSSPLRRAAAVVAAATLAFSVAACSDDSSSDATSSLTSTTESSESSTPSESETETSETETSSEEPQPTLETTTEEEATYEETPEEVTPEAPESNPYGSTMTRAEIDAVVERRRNNLGTGSCDESAFLENEFKKPIVMSCNGSWAYVAESNSDHFMVFSWGGSRWAHNEPHSHTFTGFPCWDGKTLYELGAPDDMLQQVRLCEA